MNIVHSCEMYDDMNKTVSLFVGEALDNLECRSTDNSEKSNKMSRENVKIKLFKLF